MKKVLVNAYLRQNIGDDMFVHALVRRYPNVKFYMSAARRYRRALEQEPNIVFIEDNRWRRNRLTEKLVSRFGFDACVKIGGSIFQEAPPDGKRRHTPPFLGLMYRILGGNKFIIGANFGPYFTNRFLERGKLMLRHCRGVCFRDRYSHALFAQCKNITYAPDVLFGYRAFPEAAKGDGVGISVIAPEQRLFIGQYADQYYDTLAKVCDRLIDDNIPVRLFSFCSAEGDEKAIASIRARMKNPDLVSVCTYQGDIPAFLDSFNSCESILATRFHAMVIGFALGKRVLPIIYNEKLSNVLSDIQFGGAVWNLLEGEIPGATQIIDRCLHNPKVSGMDALAQHSQGQFAKLDAYLDQ